MHLLNFKSSFRSPPSCLEDAFLPRRGQRYPEEQCRPHTVFMQHAVVPKDTNHAVFRFYSVKLFKYLIMKKASKLTAVFCFESSTRENHSDVSHNNDVCSLTLWLEFGFRKRNYLLYIDCLSQPSDPEDVRLFMESASLPTKT